MATVSLEVGRSSLKMNPVTLLRVIGGVNWAGMVLYNVVVSLYNILHLK